MTQYTPGARLKSTVSAAEFVVVRAPSEPIDLRCGGHPLATRDETVEPRTPLPGFEGDLAVGKRYSTADGSVELMVTKGGEGAVSLGEELLQRKDAKPLPSSD